MSQYYYPTPPKSPLNIVGPWNINPYIEDPESTTNFYIALSSSKNTPPSLIQVPGMRLIQAFQQGTVGRAMYTHKQYLFCVVGEFVYRLDNSLNPILIDKLTTASGRVGISSNDADQIIFVDGAAGWIYSIPANTFTRITDTNFPTGTNSVDTLNNYFLCFVGSGTSQQWQASALNDGTTWPVDNVGFFQSRPDSGLAVAVLKRNILLLGQISTETWLNPPSGNPLAPTFPFVRDDNILFEYGTAAISSVVQGLDALFWLSYDDDGPAYIMYSDGSLPRRISTPEIENAINNLASASVSSATAFIYKMNGHEFYQINFPEISFLYDLTTNMWFQVGDTAKNSGFVRHPAEAHAYFNGKHYCLSYKDGNLYQLDQFYSYYGDNPIVPQRISQRIFVPTYKNIRISYLQLVLSVFDIPLTGIYSNPTVTIETSFDRGDTWLNSENIPIGNTGQFIYRIGANRIGVAQEIVFRITCYYPIRFAILDAAVYMDEVGN